MPNKDARKDKLKTAGLVAGGAVFGKMVGASVAAGAVTTTTGTATGTVVATACGGITLAAATPYLIIGGAMCLAYSLLSDEKKSPDIVEVVNAERAPALDDVVLHAPVLQNLRDAVQDDQIAHHAVAPLLVRAARAHVERQATLILDDDAVLDTNPCTFEQLASMNGNSILFRIVFVLLNQFFWRRRREKIISRAFFAEIAAESFASCDIAH